MFRIEYTFRSSLVRRYTLGMSALALVLTFIGQVNKINYIGAIYAVGIILVGKFNQLNYVIAISASGCLFDFLYLVICSSQSKRAYVRGFLFVLHLIVFLYELVWITCMYCYMKQEQIKNEKNKEMDNYEHSVWDETSHMNESHIDEEFDSYSAVTDEMKAEISEHKQEKQNKPSSRNSEDKPTNKNFDEKSHIDKNYDDIPNIDKKPSEHINADRKLDRNHETDRKSAKK